MTVILLAILYLIMLAFMNLYYSKSEKKLEKLYKERLDIKDATIKKKDETIKLYSDLVERLKKLSGSEE